MNFWLAPVFHLRPTSCHTACLIGTSSTRGLLDVCKELGVTVIAYSPIAEGLLTGKYTPDDRPAGYRGWRLRKKVIQVQPIVEALREIGGRHEGKTPSQVALQVADPEGFTANSGRKDGAAGIGQRGGAGVDAHRTRRLRRWTRFRPDCPDSALRAAGRPPTICLYRSSRRFGGGQTHDDAVG